MGFQTLQVEDDQGGKHQLAAQRPDGSYVIAMFDLDAYEMLRMKYAPSLTAVGSTNTAGSVTVATPTPGSAIRVKWIRLKSIGNTGTNTFTLKLAGTTLYSETLDDLDAWQHGALHEGPPDGSLTLETTASQLLEYNIEYEEF